MRKWNGFLEEILPYSESNIRKREKLNINQHQKLNYN